MTIQFLLTGRRERTNDIRWSVLRRVNLSRLTRNAATGARGVGSRGLGVGEIGRHELIRARARGSDHLSESMCDVYYDGNNSGKW